MQASSAVLRRHMLQGLSMGALVDGGRGEGLSTGSAVVTEGSHGGPKEAAGADVLRECASSSSSCSSNGGGDRDDDSQGGYSEDDWEEEEV